MFLLSYTCDRNTPVACDSGNAAAHGLDSASTQHCQPPSKVANQLAALGIVWETGDHCVFWKGCLVQLSGQQLP